MGKKEYGASYAWDLLPAFSIILFFLVPFFAQRRSKGFFFFLLKRILLCLNIEKKVWDNFQETWKMMSRDSDSVSGRELGTWSR